MAQEIVVVTDIGKGGIWVESVQKSSCGSCAAKAGCGQSALESMGRPVRLWVDTELELTAGQQVVLDLPAGSLASSALALYGLPLVGLALGAMAGQAAGGESLSIVTAVLGLLAGFLGARAVVAKYRQQWMPQVVSVCASSTSAQGALAK